MALLVAILLTALCVAALTLPPSRAVAPPVARVVPAPVAVVVAGARPAPRMASQMVLPVLDPDDDLATPGLVAEKAREASK